MRIRSIRLINFRNYADEIFYFDPTFSALVGPNGSGKTNVLEAVHYLSLTRGHHATGDAQNIRRGEEFFTVIGRWSADGGIDAETEVKCTFQQGRKSVSRDGKEYRRLADHIGRFPVVQIAPQDISLIWDGGEDRRRYFDQWISQLDRNYLDDLIRYNHHLKQYQALLKGLRDGIPADPELCRLYRMEMAGPADRLTAARTRFCQQVEPFLRDACRLIAGDGEQVALRYQPSLEPGGALDRWTADFEQDQRSGRVGSGIHKDNYEFLLEGTEIRRFGSQGQQKTFLVALKLAALRMLFDGGRAPVLLLDDIFDKMDDVRTLRLLKAVGGGHLGQVILTDASPSRTAGRLNEAGIAFSEVRLPRTSINL